MSVPSLSGDLVRSRCVGSPPSSPSPLERCTSWDFSTGTSSRPISSSVRMATTSSRILVSANPLVSAHAQAPEATGHQRLSVRNHRPKQRIGGPSASSCSSRSQASTLFSSTQRIRMMRPSMSTSTATPTHHNLKLPPPNSPPSALPMPLPQPSHPLPSLNRPALASLPSVAASPPTPSHQHTRRWRRSSMHCTKSAWQPAARRKPSATSRPSTLPSPSPAPTRSSRRCWSGSSAATQLNG
mmetsp:Transcript_6173/g.12835  ORF Transcript_6173/g.12835 Transcript_6173/m.12835 type:complete len:241 (-) Transcript_6173:621-1343(-)